MATIKPFKAIRPGVEYANKVAALPYDVMNRKEAKEMADENPYSFLHVDRAEIDLEDGIYEYDERVYEKAKENLDDFITKNIMIKDNKDSIYIYEQEVGDNKQIGLITCLSVEESLNGTIKKHEYTKPDKELDRTNHIKYCNANTGTVLVTYEGMDNINDLINDYMEDNKPLYDFETTDNAKHKVWKIDNKNKIENIIKCFETVKYLYVADGHHRIASAENVAKEMKAKNPNHTGDEEYNYFLAMLAPKECLNILDYNRVVKDLNNLEVEEFINLVKENFDVREIEDNTKYAPKEKTYFGMYLDDKWYELKAKDKIINKADTLEYLDINILQNNILDKILGIKEPRKDKRIDFVGGIRGMEGLEKRVKDDMKVAFSLYPTSIDELIKVSNENKIMPAKSTWFEPKIRCGLFLHEI